MMATNHKPRIRGTDTGIWRRIRLVPFTQAIPEEKQDKRLPEKLLAELPGILNWALEGCRQWVEASKSSRSGLPECEAVRTATQEYRTEQDRLTVFLDDCTYPSAGQTLQAAVFYRIYRAWAQDNGEVPCEQPALRAGDEKSISRPGRRAPTQNIWTSA